MKPLHNCYKISIALNIIVFSLCSFDQPITLKGVWQYAGGTANGKFEGAPVSYKLQRTYTDKSFSAVMIEKGYKPEKYEAGTYILKGDTCFETSTFNSQSPQLVGKTVAYIYTYKNGVLHLAATLPSGMVADDQWNKIK